MFRRKGILVVFDRMGDYHRARVDALKKEARGYKVLSADLGASDGLYQWDSGGDDHFQLSDKSVGDSDLLTRLKRFASLCRYYKVGTLMIAGYGRIEYLCMLAIAFFTGMRVVMFAESWYGKNALMNILKGLALRWTVTGFLVSGKRAYEHFTQRLWLPAFKVHTPYSVVNNKHFAQSNALKAEPAVMLCLARFSEEKNLEYLIKSFLASALSHTWQLKLVGAGPLKEKLESLALGHNQISIENWVSYKNLPDLLVSSSCLVLPSKFEPWGLVVNEAMASGLPVVVSSATGAADDLVSAESGWVFDEQIPGELTETFNKVAATSPLVMRQKGMYGYKKIQEYSPEVWAQSALRAGRIRAKALTA